MRIKANRTQSLFNQKLFLGIKNLMLANSLLASGRILFLLSLGCGRCVFLNVEIKKSIFLHGRFGVVDF
jgi:hypothetical protein